MNIDEKEKLLKSFIGKELTYTLVINIIKLAGNDFTLEWVINSSGVRLKSVERRKL